MDFQSAVFEHRFRRLSPLPVAQNTLRLNRFVATVIALTLVLNGSLQCSSAENLRYLALPHQMRICQAANSETGHLCGVLVWSPADRHGRKGWNYVVTWDDGSRSETDLTDKVGAFPSCKGVSIRILGNGDREDTYNIADWTGVEATGTVRLQDQAVPFGLSPLSTEPLRRSKVTVPGEPPACDREGQASRVTSNPAVSGSPRSPGHTVSTPDGGGLQNEAQAKLDAKIQAHEVTPAQAAYLQGVVARLGGINEQMLTQAEASIHALVQNKQITAEQGQQMIDRLKSGNIGETPTPAPTPGPAQFIDPNFTWPSGFGDATIESSYLIWAYVGNKICVRDRDGDWWNYFGFDKRGSFLALETSRFYSFRIWNAATKTLTDIDDEVASGLTSYTPKMVDDPDVPAEDLKFYHNEQKNLPSDLSRAGATNPYDTNDTACIHK